MATQQRQPAARMSAGGNILSRMLQLERQSKYRNPPANPSPLGSQNPLSMNPPVAAVSAIVPAAKPTRPKMHAPVSPAALRESHSVPPARPSSRRSGSAERSNSLPKPDLDHTLSKPSRRPPTMPRSQTLPALSIDVKASESDNSRKNSKPEMADDEESPNEICQSPSWSDFGGAKRKKEKKRQEKERKEEEKRLRKEVKLQAAADLRAGKRLSKRPPPAAMETQKLPAVLRRNSIVSFLSSQSSSGENTRRLSRDEKRLSVASIDSAKSTLRSQSSPATSTDIRLGSSEGWKTIVSALAPQLPSLSHLGWHSRGGSSGTDKTKSWASEDAYEKELVNFAYQFQASAVPSSPTDVVLENVKVNQLSVQQSPKRHSGAWRMDRTKTESNLTDLKSNVKVKKLEPLPAVPKTESSGDNVGVDGPPRSRGAHADGSPARPRSREAANKARGDLVDGKAHRPPTETIRDIPQAALALATQGRPPVYGSSYVHKQRMHQQQRSIAGFEDEQAVRIATEWLAEEKPKDETQELAQEDAKGTHESVPQPEQRTEDLNLQGAPNTHGAVHQPQQQTEPPKSRPNVSSVPSEPKARAKEPSLTVRSSLDKHGVKAPRGSSDVAQSPTSRSSRVDKLLGFTRRQKPEQEKEASVGKASVPSTKGSRTSPPPPPPPKKTLPPPVPSSPQAKLASVQVQKAVETSPEARQHRRSESVEIVKPDVKAEEGKPSLVRSHSRTRTSSSQLLNDELPMPRPLPRSTTAPELSREMKLPSAMTDRTRNESPSKPGRKSVTFERTMDGNPEVAPSPETAVVKTPEIVVESVSPEGVIRKTSITRPRSNPNVQLAATTAQLPSLDFLPQLKHQPLPKRSPNRASFMQYPERPTSSHFPAPALFALKPAPGPSASLPLSSSAPNLQGSPHRPESYAGPSAPGEMSLRRLANNTRRSTSSPGAAAFSRAGLLGPPNVFGNTPTPSESVNAKPIAKLFVICCKCNYWHDLPSHLYEAMCLPKNLTRDPEGKGAVPKEGSVAEGKKKKVAEATLETMVKCPWCEHFMTTWCCAGWTAILYLQERHH